MISYYAFCVSETVLGCTLGFDRRPGPEHHQMLVFKFMLEHFITTTDGVLDQITFSVAYLTVLQRKQEKKSKDKEQK